MYIEIVCINKSNGDHQDISAVVNYGWRTQVGGQITVTPRMQMVNSVKRGEVYPYVVGLGGKSIPCKVMRNQYGTEYLQTYSDGRETNNLLSLNECPLG